MANDHFMKPALRTLGVFSQPPYSSEPYVSSNLYVFREKPDNTLKPMYCQGGQSKTRAANSDGYFEPFKRTFEGEALSNIVTIRRGWRKENNMKKVGREWLPSSPTKKRAGLGSTLGNFTTVIEAMSPEQKKVVKPPKLPNFYTNPGKKGTGYGYVDVCINPYPEWKAGASIYANPGPSMKELNEQHQIQCLGRPVFINQQASGNFFGPNPYEGGDPLAPGGPPIQKFGISNYPKELIIGPIFYPSNPAKKDGGCKDGALSKWPTHSAEPFKEMTKILLEKYISSPGNQQLKLWVPQPCSAIQKPSMSVINKNVDLAINSMTRKSRFFVSPMCKK